MALVALLVSAFAGGHVLEGASRVMPQSILIVQIPKRHPATTKPKERDTAMGASSIRRLVQMRLDQRLDPHVPISTPEIELVWPVYGHLVSTYGRRSNGANQEGIRIFARNGAAVRAAASGRVTFAGADVEKLGNTVMIGHGNGYITVYAHLRRITVQEGQQVTVGEQIGVLGSSGSVDEPQLYLELRQELEPVNPLTFLHLPRSGL